MKASTGLRNKLLDTGSLKATLALGFLKIYTGAEPATADAAATGTLIATISNNSTGTGVNLAAAAVAGVIPKLSSEVWSGLVAAGGPHIAGYFRHVAVGDTGALSTTEARLQGSIATAGADLNISSTTLTTGATQTIDYYSIALPTL